MLKPLSNTKPRILWLSKRWDTFDSVLYLKPTYFSKQVIKAMDFVGNVEKEVDRCLADMDVDGNGSVSYAEFMVKWKFT